MKLKIPNIKITLLLLLSLMNGATLLFAQSEELLFIDQNYPNKLSIISSVPISVKVVELNGQTNLWNQLIAELETNNAVKSIHLFAETKADEIILSQESIYIETRLSAKQIEGFSKANFTTNEIDFLVYSCTLAVNNNGKALLENIAQQTRFNVASCKSCEQLDSSEFEFDFSTADKVVNNNLFK